VWHNRKSVKYSNKERNTYKIFWKCCYPTINMQHWSMRQPWKREQRVETADITFLRSVARYTLEDELTRIKEELTNCTGQSPVWEANVSPLVKTFPAFCGTKRFIIMFTITHHWSVPWARYIQSMPSHHIYLKSILILSSYYAYIFKFFRSFSFSHHNSRHFPPPPYLQHSQPISSSFIWLPWQHFVSSTDHEASPYSFFSSILLLPPSQAQISSSAHYSQIPSVYVLP